MNKKTSQILIVYGLFLITAGLAGYLSNPEKAKTALMSGGTFGLLSIVWGVLGKLKISWSVLVARISTTFLAVVFTWRGIVTWGKFFGDSPEKLFSASLISLMLLGTFITLIHLFKNQKATA